MAHVVLDVPQLENHIAVLTLKINECQRNLEQIDRECQEFMRTWLNEVLPDTPDNRQKLTKRVTTIKTLNKKEKEEEKKFIELKKEKDAKVKELRAKYLEDIKTHYKKASNVGAGLPQTTPTSPGTVPGSKHKPKVLPPPSLNHSSLLLGTSLASVDDLSEIRLFDKAWEIPNNEIYIDYDNPEDAKIHKFPSKIIIKSSYYGDLVRGSLLGKDVCIKVLHLLNSSQINALLKSYRDTKKGMTGHPNLLLPVAGVVDFNQEKIVLEMVKNNFKSLEDVLKAGNDVKFGFHKKLQIAKSICEAMAWLHKEDTGVLHLRLKPSNILFTSDWKVKVTDYGLGLPHQYVSSVDMLYTTGHCFYFAPELFQGSQTQLPSVNSPTESDKAIDMWAFGMILWTLFMEKIPYSDATNYKEVMQRVLSHKLPELYPDTPPELKTLYHDCCHPNPRSRQKFEVLVNDECWANIPQAVQLQGDRSAKAIWKAAEQEYITNERVKDTVIPAIPWSNFANHFWEAMQIPTPVPLLSEKCVKKMFGVPDGDKAMIDLNTYSIISRVFGPFRMGPDGPAFVQSIIELLKRPWYYGADLTRQDAESILNMAREKGKKNPFLVRISIANGFFCLVSLSDKTERIDHSLLHPQVYAKEGFLAYIKSEVRKKKLSSFSYERPYTSIFTNFPQLNMDESWIDMNT